MTRGHGQESRSTLDREVSRIGVPGIQAAVRVCRFTWSGAAAGVVLQLSQRDLIDLDDPIGRWLPDVVGEPEGIPLGPGQGHQRFEAVTVFEASQRAMSLSIPSKGGSNGRGTHAAGGMGGSGAPPRGCAGERVRLYYEGAFSATGQERYIPLDDARAAR